MMKMGKFKKIIYATSTLAGTIIGVGLFALPYITAQVGLGVMLAYFLALGILVVIIHLLYSEVALNTPDYLRMTGYAKIYLGSWGRRIGMFAAIIGLFGAILAYLIVGGNFLHTLFSSVFGGSEAVYVFLYFIVGAGLIFWGIRAVSRIEFLGLLLFFAVLALIFFRGSALINVSNLTAKALDPGNLFLPYGAILFSLWGASLIPETEEILGEDKRYLKKAVFSAVTLSVIVYLLFTFLVVGITGVKTSEEAVAGLKAQLGDGIVVLMILFGLLTTFTSFIALGLTLKKVFHYDLKINKTLSWAIACFVPFILYLAGFKNFIKVIGFIGGVMLAIEGVLIILMYQKIKAGKRWLTYPLILVLGLGVLVQIVYFLK